ncbi:MAG: hypothetical protein BWY60_00044 [Actinobacteria bacterium ADurb.Bin346]|nr:MAG: hypothetical protein BWY60_00044 [Actinobacteria bacterium ADurb.Bin346]
MKKSDVEPKFRYKDTNFAHESEREFAKILDFYDIDWDYEPKTFPVEWDREGNPKISFTPDFFLPDYDLFIELTTLNQKLVTKKNKKLKRIRELYPEVNIKLFYKKDFQSLLFNKEINK